MTAAQKRALIKHGRMGIARNSPRGFFKTLRAVFTRLPLETVFQVFGFLDAAEQLGLQDVLFGRIVNWRRDVRRGRVTPEQIERMQGLFEKHVAAAKSSPDVRLRAMERCARSLAPPANSQERSVNPWFTRPHALSSMN
jgi:hypothetical protein